MPEPEFDEPEVRRFLSALRLEAEAHRVGTGAGTATVPHRYLIELPGDAYLRYVPRLDALRGALVRAQLELTRDEGWTTRGDVSVEIGPGEGLLAEQFRVIVDARPPTPPPSAGTVLDGRYRLDQRLAAGGTGDVWRGVDELDGGPIAVKVINAHLLDEPGATARFLADARAVAAVRHPGLVELRDCAVDPTFGGYVVMPLVDGDALAPTLARAGRLPPQRTLALVAQVADALHALHSAGLVHREVGPHHLLVRSDGAVLLTAVLFPRRPGLDGLVAGCYVAPEEAMGPLTARSDIYALGVVAYQCLAGRRPFDVDSPLDAVLRRRRDDPPPLPDDLPAPVRSIVERALARDPAGGWPSAADLATAARLAQAGP